MKPCPKNRRRRKRASCHVNGHCTLLRTSKAISVYLRFERGKVKHWTEPCPSPACRSPCGAFPGTNLPSAVSLQGRNSSRVIDAKCVLLSAFCSWIKSTDCSDCGDLQFLRPYCAVLSSLTHWESWGDENRACSLCLSNAAPWMNVLFWKNPVNAFLY